MEIIIHAYIKERLVVTSRVMNITDILRSDVTHAGKRLHRRPTTGEGLDKENLKSSLNRSRT